MLNPNHTGSTATSERLRSSVADDLPVQPSGMPSPTAVGSEAPPSDNGEPTAISEPIPTGHLPAASPLPDRRPAGARRLTAGEWIPLALLALIVVAIAAGLGRDSDRGSQGADEQAVPASAPVEKPQDGAR